MNAKIAVYEFGMGVDVHGLDGTKAACRAVSDAIRHSSLPLYRDVRERGGKMLVDVTIGIPDGVKVDTDVVKKELPHGDVTVKVGKLNGKIVQVSPEFESCRKLAEQAKLPLKEIYEAAIKAVQR